MFMTDDKLPEDVVRREYAETKHALCCLSCGFEHGLTRYSLAPLVSRSGFFWSMSASLRRAECVLSTPASTPIDGILRTERDAPSMGLLLCESHGGLMSIDEKTLLC